MQRNLITWLAIFSSLVAGTFACHWAAKYPDAQAEAAIQSVAGLKQAGYVSAVALSRGAASYGESLPE
jgi:hypothetical protein